MSFMSFMSLSGRAHPPLPQAREVLPIWSEASVFAVVTPNLCRLLYTSLLALWLFSVSSSAEPPLYQEPPSEIARWVDAAPTSWAVPAPTGGKVLLMTPSLHRPLAELRRETAAFAGLVYDPERGLKAEPIRLRQPDLLVVGDQEVVFSRFGGLPSNGEFLRPSWSPRGETVALERIGADGLELWLLDDAQRQARRLTAKPLAGILGPPCSWEEDGLGLLCIVRSGAAGARTEQPSGPEVRESPAAVGQEATAGELRDSETRLLAQAASAQLFHVRLDSTSDALGSPGLLRRPRPSPDGRFVLIQRVTLPEMALQKGQVEVTLQVLDRTAGSSVVFETPLGSVALRSLALDPSPLPAWLPETPATLVWLSKAPAEADPTAGSGLSLLPAPFRAEDKIIAALEGQPLDVWLSESFVLFSRTAGPGGLALQALAFEEGSDPRSVWEGSSERSPWPLSRSSGSSGRVLETSRKTPGRALLSSSDGSAPCLVNVDLASGEKRPIWCSPPEAPEEVLGLLESPAKGRAQALIRRESPTEPPNLFLRDLRSGEVRQLTDRPSPLQVLERIERIPLHYSGAGGRHLTTHLLLPPGEARLGGHMPALLWIYPSVRGKQDPASKNEPKRFPSLRHPSPLPWLEQGFAVIDGPPLPIVIPKGQKGADDALAQLLETTNSLVEAALATGKVAPDRIAVGGHSFGASTAVLLLAHTDLFKVGIALSGAYNRTLTPFGFQYERRALWQAPEVYRSLSAFHAADRITEPLLLIHGAADAHPSTPPIQSERLFEALKAYRRPARLVLFPHEGHNLRARESLLHLMWEMDRWLRLHVLDAAQEAEEQMGAGSAASSMD